MTTTSLKKIQVPDIGNAADVAVIEILVAPGQTVNQEDSLITLESEKATMEVPSPEAGEIAEIKVKVGDKVSEGDLILLLKTSVAATPEKIVGEKKVEETISAKETPKEIKPEPVSAAKETKPVDINITKETSTIHASPAIRRLAREFGVDLTKVTGTAPKNRILKEDIQNYVKQQLANTSSSGFSVPSAPKIDFSKFGEIEIQALSKIKRLTGVNVHRSWITVPHVTQFDEADITEMEEFRQANKEMAEKRGIKLTPLVFVMKAVVAGLKEFPHFNASLDADQQNLILKKYFHLGVAVDTSNGLVVPVIRHVDQKSLLELAKELAEISQKAREKGLTPSEMSGSCFTISSLGGISGTAFTPIVNTPDVAILGVSKAKWQPVYQNEEFIPRLIMPLSLSYDHRVIDGAEGARFTKFLAECLSDLKRLLL